LLGFLAFERNVTVDQGKFGGAGNDGRAGEVDLCHTDTAFLAGDAVGEATVFRFDQFDGAFLLGVIGFGVVIVDRPEFGAEIGAQPQAGLHAKLLQVVGAAHHGAQDQDDRGVGHWVPPNAHNPTLCGVVSSRVCALL